MPEYRIYTIDFLIECADDAGAVQEALLAINGHDVELWEGKRLIVRVPRYQKPAK
jgi:hypothetical protein